MLLSSIGQACQMQSDMIRTRLASGCPALMRLCPDIVGQLASHRQLPPEAAPVTTASQDIFHFQE